MFRAVLLAGLVCLLLTGCGKTKSFEAALESRADDRLQVDCSSAVNKGKRNVDDVGYVCIVELTEETKLSSESGRSVSRADLEPPALLRIVLAEPSEITEDASTRSSGLVAEEIMLLNR